MSGARPVRVVLADDQPIVRAGVAMPLGAEPDLAVVGEADDGAEVLDLAERTRPDVVVMDLHMPHLDGIGATRALCADRTDEPDRVIRVLALTTFDDDEMVHGVLRAGASGFLLKSSAPGTLVAAIRHVAAGGAWIDPQVAPAVLRGLAAGAAGGGVVGAGATGRGGTGPAGSGAGAMVAPSAASAASAARGAVAQLTAREQEVLALMAHGLTNSEIAARFVLSESTVKTHVARVLMKTGSHDRARAVVLAYRAGLVAPDDEPDA